MLDKYAGTPATTKSPSNPEIEDGTTRQRLLTKNCVKKPNQIAAALRSLGLGKGDRHRVFMPMVP